MRCVGDKEISYDHKSRISKEKILSSSANNSTQQSERKYCLRNQTDDDIHSSDEYHQKGCHSLVRGRDQRQSHRSDRLSSEVDDLPCSSSWNSDEGKKHHHNIPKKHSGTDFSRQHHQARNRSELERKRVEYDVKRHSQKHRYIESELEESTSGDQNKPQKEASRSSKHSKHNSESKNVEPSYERWKMIHGSDEDGSEEYRYYKRKRGH